MTLPEGKAGKALALGLCGILLVLAGRVVVQPLIEFHANQQEELALLGAQRARLARVQGELPELRQQVSDLRQQKQATDGQLLLPESSDAVAAATLQTKIKALGASLGAEINSVESLVPQPQDGFRRVGVRVVIRGDLNALTGILSALATTRPPLFVDNLEIRNGSFSAQPGSDTTSPMNIGMDVYGFRVNIAQTADTRG